MRYTLRCTVCGGRFESTSHGAQYCPECKGIPPQYKRAATSLYVIADRDAKRVKIGISCNPGRRLSELCFPDLEIVYEARFGSRWAAQKNEQALHKHFFRHRIGSSEWFRFSDDLNEDNAHAVLCALMGGSPCGY